MSPYPTETLELAVKLSSGNPGASRVLVEILCTYADSPQAGALLLALLNNLQITGAAIWILYKDDCDEIIAEFSRAVIIRASKILAGEKL